MPKTIAFLSGIVLLLGCSRSPDPRKIGVFAETDAGTLELPLYGSENHRDSFTEGLTEGFTFPQGQAIPNAASVKSFYINLPSASIEESKVYALTTLNARWHLQGHMEADPKPLATQLLKSENGIYSLTGEQLQASNSGYLGLLVKMPMGQADRLYAVQISPNASSRQASSEVAALRGPFDSWLSEVRLTFVREGVLYTAAADGSDARSLGIQGVGALSTSLTGALAYDRFAPARGQAQDLNVYVLDRIDGTPKRITDDNQSIRPVMSPNGRYVVYQKLEWNGAKWYDGKGRGLWLYDLEHGEQRQMAGALEDTSGLFDPRNWRYDEYVQWSSDSQLVFFERYYESGRGGLWPREYVASLPSGNVEPFKKEISPGAYIFPKAFGRGKVLAVYRAGPDESLVEEDLATGQLRTVVSNLGHGHSLASFSPDESLIAYSLEVAKDASDLWIVKSDGSDLRKLTTKSISTVAFGPSWSPAGNSLLITSSLLNGGRISHSDVLRVEIPSGRQEIVGDGARIGSWIIAQRVTSVWKLMIVGILLPVVGLLVIIAGARRRRVQRALVNSDAQVPADLPR